MTSKPLFNCSIYHQPARNPSLCLDRRVEKASIKAHQGKKVTVIKIAVRQTMFIYCSRECWQLHQPSLAGQLQLQSTCPAFHFLTPCSRCRAAVDLTQHYVNYSISELNLKGTSIFDRSVCR